jgi:hypothetical protein
MVEEIRICGCGLIKQSKVGSTSRDGVAFCNACGLPREIPSDLLGAASINVPMEQVTTLQSLPGYRTVRSVGVVAEVSATSGLTATAKGTSALGNGLVRLREAAGIMGANAILGLVSSAFGAAGGITSAFGGDAVGVLLIGTAAVVELDEDELP